MYEGIAAAGEAVLVMQLPDERILLATDAARSLLAPADVDPVGRTLSDFLDAPVGESGRLLADGRLDGFQLYRLRAAPPGAELEIWVSAGPDRRDTLPAAVPVLALLSQAGDGLRWAASQPDDAAATVAGWVDQQLLVQQADGEVTGLAGQPAEELIGRSLLGLVMADDLPRLLFALGRVAGSQEAVSLPVRLPRADQEPVRCRLVLVPLSPAPSCAFAVQAAEPAGADPLLPLRRFGQGIAAASSVRELTVDRAWTALSELTTRELQIVNRLLAGDRVPAISRQLYLAQSTVRNHLSAVFAKLGVRSQQELIELLRSAQSRSD